MASKLDSGVLQREHGNTSSQEKKYYHQKVLLTLVWAMCLIFASAKLSFGNLFHYILPVSSIQAEEFTSDTFQWSSVKTPP